MLPAGSYTVLLHPEEISMPKRSVIDRFLTSGSAKIGTSGPTVSERLLHLYNPFTRDFHVYLTVTHGLILVDEPATWKRKGLPLAAPME